MRRLWTALAILLVLATDAVILIGVSKNRSGSPFQTIELTERELVLQSTDQDNSGVGLILRWTRQLPRDRDTRFPREKLEACGFDLRVPAGAAAKDISILPRPGFVVLEYEGERYLQWERKRATEPPGPATEDPSMNPAGASRLFPVDIGVDPAELRRRYPDQSRYMVARAGIRAIVEDPGPQITGAVMQVQPYYVTVPLPHSRMLAGLKPQSGKPPRYTITLAFGRNLEPWVTSVKLNR